MPVQTFVDEAETIVDEVAKWGAKYVKDIVDALAPNGRPFGTVQKSVDEQLDEYRNIRNDVDGWKLWIANRQQQINDMLATSGVSPEQIQVISPLKIASSFALEYSLRMEKLLENRML